MLPEHLLLVVLIAAMTLYAVLGGADFGAGVWQFATGLRADEEERKHLYKAIGPVWEANHVWLIFVMMILFNGFPVAFAGLGRALWLPLMLAVWGIIFRGAGYAFRSYTLGGKPEKTMWEFVFALASTATPLFLGAAAGAIASGRLEITSSGGFQGDYLADWITPLSVFTGMYTISLCAYLSAVYLVREACLSKSTRLERLWKRRAIITGIWMGVLSFLGLVVVAFDAPSLANGFAVRGWPLIISSAMCGAVSLVALVKDRFNLSVLASASAVASVVVGWGVAQFPVIIPPNIVASQAAAPDNVLWMMLGVIVVGMVALLPALGYLFWLFKSNPR